MPLLWFVTALVFLCPAFSKWFSVTRTIILVLCLTTALPAAYFTARKDLQATRVLRQGIEKIKHAKHPVVVFSQMKHFDTALKALFEDNGLSFVPAAPTDTLVPLFVYKKRLDKLVVVCQKID